MKVKAQAPSHKLRQIVAGQFGKLTKPQATSNKLKRLKLQRLKLQAASAKAQAARVKLQAASIKLLDILPLIKFYLVKGEGLNHDKCILRMITMK